VSNPRKPTKAVPPAITPMIGALLRLPHEVVVARMLSALNTNGFDLTLTELGVFLYPGPDGRRPIDLARQCNATRQTMNYVLTSLEQRGYIERRAESGSTTRLVHVPKRGWELVSLIRSTLGEIEKDWSKHLGAQRFKVLRETLRDLAQWLGKLE